MSIHFRRKQYSDALPFVYEAGYSQNPQPNFVGADVRFKMRRPEASECKVDGVGTIDTDANEFSYAPEPEDVDEPGAFFCEWVVTYSNGKTERWPTVGWLTVFFERAL